jgi:hypothetical protein
VTQRGAYLVFQGKPYIAVMAQIQNTCPPRDFVDQLVRTGIDLIFDVGPSCPTQAGADGRSPRDRVEASLTGRSPTLWYYEASPASNQLAGLPQLVRWEAKWQVAIDYSWSNCSEHSTLGLYNLMQKRSSDGRVQWAYVRLGSARSSDQREPRVCVTPAKVAAEVWTAIIGGGTGVNWLVSDPHNHSGNGWDFSVSPAVVSEAAALASDLRSYSAILATGTAVTASATGRVRVLARSYAGSTYVFAVNTRDAPEADTIQVSGLANGTATSLNGGPSQPLRRGSMQVTFDPLAVQIFRLAPA